MAPRWPGTVATPAAAAAFLTLDLVAHGGNRLGAGADEDDARLGQFPGKCVALREKSVTGMHGLGPGFPASGHNVIDDEIAFCRGRRADEHRLVGHFDVQRVLVCLGIDRDRLNTQATGGLDDPTGDLAPIGDQNALEHAAT